MALHEWYIRIIFDTIELKMTMADLTYDVGQRDEAAANSRPTARPAAEVPPWPILLPFFSRQLTAP